MNNKRIFEKIITEKRAKSSNKRPKYGLRKLTVGVVSCLLGYMMFFTPNVVAAENEKVDQPQAIEATFESAKDNNVENVEEEAAEIAETKATDLAKTSSVAKKSAVQPRSATTTEATAETNEKTTEFKLTDEQKKQLVDAGLTEEEIKFVTNEIKSELATNKDFKVDEYLAKVIELKKEGKDIGIASISRDDELSINDEPFAGTNPVGAPNNENVDALTSATYYNKANWENKIKDKSRWKVEDSQNLVRVNASDPIGMTDVDYDGIFVDANGRYVIRLLYKEKATIASGVWYRALFNFGDLDQYIDYDLTYVVGKDEKSYPLEPFDNGTGRMLDVGRSVTPRTDNRTNLPINLVLKEGVDLKTLGSQNYIVQMRLTDKDGKRIYTYAPKKTSMDYSTYTKSTSVSLDDKVNNLFMKGGYQKDSENATYQESFMSEFIANPKEYNDKSNLGIIRTEYLGERSGNAKSPTVEGQPMAFTQAFDANLVKYFKPDDKGNIAYVTVLTLNKEASSYSHRFGIPKDKINYSTDRKLAYFVIAPKDFEKEGVNVVNIPSHDQYTILQGIYITAIDYVVDKGEFENTFSENKTRKLDYSMISGWTNPNKDGWTIFEKVYDKEYVVPEGESYLIDTTSVPEGKQIMIRIGDDQAIIRRGQGYYNGLSTSKGAIEKITEYAKGVYEFTLREGATVKAGQKLRVYMPYTSDHNEPVNFLEMHNGTKLDQGAATLKLQKDRNINMHLYTDLPRGATFKLKYTLKGQTEEKELVFTKPKGLGTLWQYKDSDNVLTGIPNRSILSSGGNFWINTKALEPGKDIIVEAYDENGNEIEDRKSWFKYVNIPKSDKKYTDLTWTDHSDKSSILI